MRAGEAAKTYFRSDRFYAVNDQFYFSTREGYEVGPFDSKKHAEEGLQHFITSIAQGVDAACAAKRARQGSWAATLFQ